MKPQIFETDDLDSCLSLRRAVFIDEQGVPEAEEQDEYDANAIHLLATDGNIAVGCARIVLNDHVGKIGRVCVLKSHRGAGLGSDLINAALTWLQKEQGVKLARLGAQTHALGFYERLGFAVVGPEYQDAGIAHFDMERKL
ncbi:MAG TPA: drug:proton antiporter [Rhodobacteraceae bacterium]|jgi:ElaA protein|nr:drug:proton antiporter [Paracoccaceae bacterium]